MITPSQNETTKACPHGFHHPVACPQCEPDVYARARPQIERRLREQAAAGRTFTIERIPDGLGGALFACGILPMRRDRDALIRDIERSQGPEWRKG